MSKPEPKRALRYPLKGMGLGDNENKQDMLYIKIFTPKRSEDIYSLNNMFETEKVKQVYDGGPNDGDDAKDDKGNQLYNEYVTGFKPIRTRDEIFNEVGAQTAEIQ